MLNVKRIAVLCGLSLASAWLGIGCGTSNNVVPQVPSMAAGGVTGVCALGATYLPSTYGNGGSGYGNSYGYGYNNVGTYGGCVAGYVLNGAQCVCTTSYGTSYGYGYANGACPAGMVMYGGSCSYPTYGATTCPAGQVYTPNYGCRY